MKKCWYFVFEESQTHPKEGFSLKYYYVSIRHRDKLRARAEMISRFGDECEGWSRMMDEMEFRRHQFGINGIGGTGKLTNLISINILD